MSPQNAKSLEVEVEVEVAVGPRSDLGDGERVIDVGNDNETRIVFPEIVGGEIGTERETEKRIRSERRESRLVNVGKRSALGERFARWCGRCVRSQGLPESAAPN